MQIVKLAVRMPQGLFPLPRLLLLGSVALGLMLPATAGKPKFAVVDVTRAFEAYHLAAEEKARIVADRSKLKKDPRLEKIKLTRVELLDLRNNVRDGTLSEAEREEYFRKFQMKAYELRALQRDTVQNLEEQSKNIDADMVKKTRHLLGEVHAAIRKVSLEGDFDHVFEKSGKTSSQIPPLIYIRDATDITDLVIEVLNKDAPPKKDVATSLNGPPSR